MKEEMGLVPFCLLPFWLLKVKMGHVAYSTKNQFLGNKARSNLLQYYMVVGNQQLQAEQSELHVCLFLFKNLTLAASCTNRRGTKELVQLTGV